MYNFKLSLNKSIITVILLVIILSLLLYLISIELIAVLLIGIITIIALFVSYRLIIYFILYLSFFLDNFLFHFKLNTSFINIIDLLILLLFIYALSNFVVNRRKNIFIDNFKYVTILLVLNIIISILLNNNPLILVAKSLSYHVRYILFFISLLMLEEGLEFYIKITKIIIIFGILQIPFSIIQKIIYSGMSYDFMGGTISIGGYSTNSGAVFSIMMMSLCFIGYQIYKEKKYLYLIFLFFIPIVLSSARAALFFIPINIMLYVFYLGMNKKLNLNIFSNIILLIVISIFIYISFVYVLPFFSERDLNALQIFTDLEKFNSLVYGKTKIGTISRFEIFVFLGNLLNSNPLNFFIGYGPGSHTASQMLSLEGAPLQYYGMFLRGLTSIAYTILEMGVIYFVLIVLFLVKCAVMAKKLFIDEKNKFWKMIFGSYLLIILTYIYSSIYWKIWLVHGISFTVWFMTAAIITYTKNEKKNS